MDVQRFSKFLSKQQVLYFSRKSKVLIQNVTQPGACYVKKCEDLSLPPPFLGLDFYEAKRQLAKKKSKMGNMRGRKTQLSIYLYT